MDSKDILAAASLAKYTNDPEGFADAMYPWGEGTLANEDGPRDWQRIVLKKIGKHLQNPDTRFTPLQLAVASGHGIGKSALMAMLTQWGMSTMPDTRGVITANTESQLRTKTWTEQSVWFNRLACREYFRLEGMSLRGRGHEQTWRFDAIPWSENNPEAFAGMHNKGGRILILMDEASAIANKIWEVVSGALTDEDTQIILVVFGNPTRSNGKFFDCFHKDRAYWDHVQIDSRTVPGTNKALFDAWEKQYGEDSDFFMVRVRGMFPRSSSNQLIGYDLISGSQGLDVAPRISDPLVFGLDVARYGDDQSVLYPRKGNVAGIHGGPWSWRGLGNVELAHAVAVHLKELKPDALFIDGGGPGGGVVDVLRDWRYEVFEIAFGGTSPDSDYANMRAYMWAKMRDWLINGGSIPWSDNDLTNDLMNQTYQYQLTKTNALILTAKEAMKREGLPSPDYGDALALTFAHPIAPHTGAAGRQGDIRDSTVDEDWTPGWE